MIPGVGFFYSGLARRKSALSLIWLSLMSIAIVSFQVFSIVLLINVDIISGFSGDTHLLSLGLPINLLAISTILVSEVFWHKRPAIFPTSLGRSTKVCSLLSPRLLLSAPQPSEAACSPAVCSS